jgi:hypothetical protein
VFCEIFFLNNQHYTFIEQPHYHKRLGVPRPAHKLKPGSRYPLQQARAHGTYIMSVIDRLQVINEIQSISQGH